VELKTKVLYFTTRYQLDQLIARRKAKNFTTRRKITRRKILCFATVAGNGDATGSPCSGSKARPLSRLTHSSLHTMLPLIRTRLPLQQWDIDNTEY
jgi:hypothetical protein